MSKPKGFDEQAGYAGGWIPRVYPGTPPDSYRYAKNVQMAEDGRLRSRQGTRRLLASAMAGAITSVFGWRVGVGTRSTILLISGGSLYATTFSSNTLCPAPTLLGAGASSLPHIGWASFRDGTNECVYTPRAAGGLLKWDGTTFATIPAAASVQQLWVANNRLFGLNASSGDTLYWSAIGNGDTLGIVASGGGFATVRAYGSSTGIVTGFALGATVVLVHDAGISFFRGNTADDIDINAGTFGVAQGIGAFHRTSVAVFDTFAHVFSSQGMYTVTEGGVSPLFTPERPDIPTALNGGAMDGTARPADNLRAFPNPSAREIWWMATDASGNPAAVYVWHVDYKRWVAEYTFPASNQIPTTGTVAHNDIHFPAFVMGCADGQLRATSFEQHQTSTIVYQDNVDTAGANGSDISCQVKCRRFWTGAPFSTKQFDKALLIASLNQNATVVVSETTPSGSAGSSTTLAQPSSISGDVPLAYAVSLGTTGPFTDLTAGWTGSPRVTLSEIATDAKVIGERGA